MGCIYLYKAKRQPIQSVIIKSIEQNMTCVYEARRRILEFSSQSVRVDFAQVGVANGKIKGEFESSGETSLTSFISSVSEIPNRSVQIPMSFSEDRIASKAGFTSSGSYTTMAAGATSGQASFTGSGLFSGETMKKTGHNLTTLPLNPSKHVYTLYNILCVYTYTHECTVCNVDLMHSL